MFENLDLSLFTDNLFYFRVDHLNEEVRKLTAINATMETHLETEQSTVCISNTTCVHIILLQI